MKWESLGAKMKRNFIAGMMIILAALAAGCTYKQMQKFSVKYDHSLNKIRKPPEVANYMRDVVWASPGGEDLLLDVSWPEGEGPFPMVVNIHGGAFFMATKAIDEALCRHLTNHGYTVINVNYRLAPQHKFPAAVNDCLGAVVWAKAHARDYRGDPSRVAVMGGSAGGNLAGMVALAWDDPYFTPTFQADGYDASVKAAVLIFGVHDMTIMEHPGDSLDNPYLGGSPEDIPELFEKSSPISYLDRENIPPIMLVCGDKDGLYPQSVDMDARLEDLGVPHEFYTAHGKGHGFTNWHWQEAAHQAFDAIADWLDTTL